ncbi:flavodoxin domain-containing protein [Oenococcus oeni]|uniref:Flavodoxin-like domain-containing protein n=11 Tax=Oenococcus oeni TaxID=1247 RepID=D3L7T6_OENOE|nr:flavodoxin domain-containing protein [Oenococcus oeni]EFD89020.1 hypothetical protein AWRIB429_0416 [Oenococcus oeni AWRIB429]KGH53083.1 flavodoxin [Oenococcus oeni S11]KGH54690.1 flavodoxin [Oenococcus oeni IOEB_S277]KGH58143.1 flavodoxin [Oenococcus oeni IOEB_B10]KGH59207.1 flavodoxin [Oenococcus oeni S28]KGH63504.1 flavodoxin [Oenococcus oeni IOEB_CiNe]KGH69460.1 flavodoxin [Oenococcus oeni IOEB_9517]KGH73074.1 flavodoxin [Oenococcus oeni IOEB_0608]KGH83305.1 flavodoxin [Oenococcus o
MKALAKKFSTKIESVKVDIIYATITGNNELLANAVANEFKKRGQTPEIHEFDDTDIFDLEDSDIIVLVCYTYDNGSIPDESLDFFDDMQEIDWTDKICAILGSGDKFYGKDYCKAVDTFAEQIKKTGANLATSPVKIQLAPDESDAPAIKKCVSELLAASN